MVRERFADMRSAAIDIVTMQLQRLEETAAASSAELVQLDEQRSVVKARLEEARVGILLARATRTSRCP
jgi:hypothetical protein